MTEEQRQFSLYGQTLPYLLKRSDRRTLQISIHPDRRIVVHAPRTAGVEAIQALLEKRARWIDRTLRKLDRLPPPLPPRLWISGETHRYLGRQYRLKVDRGELTSIKLQGGFFYIVVADIGDTETIRKLMENWYLDRAKVIFPERLDRCLEQSRAILELPPIEIRLKIRPMRTRWGSCSEKGNINLNIELIKAPLDCVDYVITHELCHLKEMNHGQRFWRLLGQCMPDWERRQAKLSTIELSAY